MTTATTTQPLRLPVDALDDGPYPFTLTHEPDPPAAPTVTLPDGLTDAHLIAEFLGASPIMEILQNNRIKLADFEAWLAQPYVQAKLARLHRVNCYRARIIASEQFPFVVHGLVEIATDHTRFKAVSPETRRRAARDLAALAQLPPPRTTDRADHAPARPPAPRGPRPVPPVLPPASPPETPGHGEQTTAPTPAGDRPSLHQSQTPPASRLLTQSAPRPPARLAHAAGAAPLAATASGAYPNARTAAARHPLPLSPLCPPRPPPRPLRTCLENGAVRPP